MTTHTGTESEALAALSGLVDLARAQRDAAQHAHRTGTAQTFDGIAVQLDRVRTRLAEDHGAYLAEAWAFVDAGRLTIGRHVANLSRRRL